jgi:hypothetical protein
MGSLKQHIRNTEIILANNCLIDHDILERLKEHHALTVTAPIMSGAFEWEDIATILRSESEARFRAKQKAEDVS